MLEGLGTINGEFGRNHNNGISQDGLKSIKKNSELKIGETKKANLIGHVINKTRNFHVEFRYCIL